MKTTIAVIIAAIMMVVGTASAMTVTISAGTGSGETETMYGGTMIETISMMETISMDMSGEYVSTERSIASVTPMTTTYSIATEVNGHKHMHTVHNNHGDTRYTMGVHEIVQDGDVVNYTVDGVKIQ